MRMINPTIGIVVPTLNAEHHLKSCLLPLINSPLKPKILVIDSSSGDNTVRIAQELGVETFVISKADFNHGETREQARKMLGTDIVVMVTQDAYASNNQTLEKLIQPIVSGKAAVAYARQIPRKNAGFLESFAREFNYPDSSQLRGIEDMKIYGVYTFFCSDSFAAYSNKALDEIGGFSAVLLGEDTLAVAKLLRADYKIAYVAEALVNHSHGYSIREEFHHYFDTGIARQEYQQWIACDYPDSHRGIHYAKLMVRHLVKKKPWLLPYAFVQTLAKWIGYRLGSASVKAPVWLKRRLSGQKFYWASNPYLKKQTTEQSKKSFR